MLLRKIYKDSKHRTPLFIVEYDPLAYSCNSSFVPVYNIVACHFSSVRWPSGLVFILYQYVQGICMCGEREKATDFVSFFLYLSIYRLLYRLRIYLFIHQHVYPKIVCLSHPASER